VNSLKSDNDEDDSNNETPHALAAEIISRVFLWAADAKTIDETGCRTMVALACIRPDLYNGISLAALGRMAGRQRQAIFKLQNSFKQTTGFKGRYE